MSCFLFSSMLDWNLPPLKAPHMTPPPGLSARYEYSHKLGKIVHKKSGRPVNEWWNAKCKGSRYGKVRTTLLEKHYLYHRLVWELVYGAPPPGDIDHIDQNPRNNRVENLRVVTHKENIHNRSKRGCIYKTQCSQRRRGYVWIAQLVVDGKQRRASRCTRREATAVLAGWVAEHWGATDPNPSYAVSP